MQTGQQLGEHGEVVRVDSQSGEIPSGSEPDATEGDVIFGIVNIGSHDTLGSHGLQRGYLMTIIDLSGSKYFVDIPHEMYVDLLKIYNAAYQPQQPPSIEIAPTPPKEESNPTGSPEEIERMRRMLIQEAPEDVMKKLGFVSDENMQNQQAEDPVEDILAMASSDDEEYEDPGEESFDEGVEGL